MSGRRSLGRNQSFRNESSCVCLSAPAIGIEAVLAVSCAPPAGPVCFCRDVCVWTHTEFPSWCILHSNILLCPLWSQSSAEGITHSLTCPWRWRCGSWGMGYSLCHNQNLCVQSTPCFSLGTVGASASNDWWLRNQRQHRWGTVSEGFTRLVPNSCRSTWDRTPGDKENHYSQSPTVRNFSWTHVWILGHTVWRAVTRYRRRNSSLIFWTTALPFPETSVLCEEWAVRSTSLRWDLT
jgi:hypothetical protein